VLATVLFFDVVQSTALASELGDKRWGELLVRMRRVVARELKQGRGREQDFSGDGFLAVFSEPAQAVRTAVSIIAALHRLGLDVRCGVHSGECEVIDGKMRGIAVHIGARVMALAEPCAVLVTGTVRDLVVGSGIRFEEHGMHELKGVDGAWVLYRAVQVDGRKVEKRLSPAEANARIAALDLGGSGSRRTLTIAAVVGVLVLAAAIGVPLAVLGRGSGAARFGTDSIVRIDPRTGRILEVARDPFAVPDYPTHVFAYRGTLWDWDDNYGFIRRDMQTGRVIATLDRFNRACPNVPAWDIALGTIWLTCTAVQNGVSPEWLVRLDELSFRHLATIPFPHGFMVSSAGWGLGAYWVVDTSGELVRADALTNRAVTYDTAVSTSGSCIAPSWYPGIVGPVVVDDRLWFAQCNPNRLIRFDPSTRRSATVPIPQEVGWLQIVPGVPHEVWLFDPFGGTITPFDTGSRTMGEPIALPGTPQSTAVSADAIWVAAGGAVDRVAITPTGHATTSFTMPSGVWASSIAVDPSTGIVWVASNTYQRSHPEWAGPSGP
jgi:streptogramin lyase